MIYLYKNQSNTVVLTLDEKATNTTHDWLIEFTNDITGSTELVTVTDISTTPSRFNEFVIVEPSDVELQTGVWQYTVYEMPVSSPPSTNTALAYATVETGKMWVEDVTENVPTVFDEEETKDNVTFDEE